MYIVQQGIQRMAKSDRITARVSEDEGRLFNDMVASLQATAPYIDGSKLIREMVGLVTGGVVEKEGVFGIDKATFTFGMSEELRKHIVEIASLEDRSFLYTLTHLLWSAISAYHEDETSLMNARMVGIYLTDKAPDVEDVEDLNKNEVTRNRQEEFKKNEAGQSLAKTKGQNPEPSEPTLWVNSGGDEKPTKQSRAVKKDAADVQADARRRIRQKKSRGE